MQLSLDDRKVIIFNLNDEEYATNINQVERIVEADKITRIPEAVDYLMGVIDNNGSIVPVIDLKKRFQVPGEPRTENQSIIIAKKDQGDIGLAVDSVSEITEVPEDALCPTPDTITGIVKDFIKGVIRMDGRVIIYINLEKILNFDERQQLMQL